jgi:type VI secretion system protein
MPPDRPLRLPARGLYRRLAAGLPPLREHESLLAHLQAILNTHLGESLSAPGLGIVDFADIVHGFPGSAQVLALSIRTTLLQHEPRLRAVHVAPAESADLLALAFDISARFTDERRGPLQVRTELSVGGRFHVQGAQDTR